MFNWFKRQLVLFNEEGRVFHFGDGKDYIRVQEFESKEIAPHIFSDKEADDYGKYLRHIGFKDIRVVGESVFRFESATSGTNMVRTKSLYQ